MSCCSASRGKPMSLLRGGACSLYARSLAMRSQVRTHAFTALANSL